MYRGFVEIRVENSKGIAYISSDAIRTLKHLLFSPEMRYLRNKFHHIFRISPKLIQQRKLASVQYLIFGNCLIFMSPYFAFFF